MPGSNPSVSAKTIASPIPRSQVRVQAPELDAIVDGPWRFRFLFTMAFQIVKHTMLASERTEDKRWRLGWGLSHRRICGIRRDILSLRGRIMDWIKLSSLLVTAGLAACASTGTSNSGVVKTGLPTSENFRVERSPSPEYDYLVSIKNGKDLGIDANNQLARDQMALLALKNQCEAPQIVKEFVVNSGSDLFGSAERTYRLHIKC